MLNGRRWLHCTMKKILLLPLSLILCLSTLVSCGDEPEEKACWEFHHSIRYRSPDSQWESHYDTVCNITESRAEEIRVANDQNNSQWIINCAKRKITSQHKHVSSSYD